MRNIFRALDKAGCTWVPLRVPRRSYYFENMYDPPVTLAPKPHDINNSLTRMKYILESHHLSLRNTENEAYSAYRKVIEDERTKIYSTKFREPAISAAEVTAGAQICVKARGQIERKYNDKIREEGKEAIRQIEEEMDKMKADLKIMSAQLEVDPESYKDSDSMKLAEKSLKSYLDILDHVVF